MYESLWKTVLRRSHFGKISTGDGPDQQKDHRLQREKPPKKTDVQIKALAVSWVRGSEGLRATP